MATIKLELKAVIDKKGFLEIRDSVDNTTLSRKEVKLAQHRGRFVSDDEEIHYIYEKIGSVMSNGFIERVFFYPLNINYKENPVTVERL